MNHSHLRTILSPIRPFVAVLALGLAAIAVLGAARANAAAFEQMGCFAGSFPGLTESCKPVAEKKFGEEVQLGGVGGMAVNYTGSGGVPAGTVYAIVKNSSGPAQVSMFEPDGSGGLKFVEGWSVTIAEGTYVRCGPPGELPDGETVHPSCPPRAEAVAQPVDVEVDQQTGNVYAQFLVGSAPAGAKAIVVYSPDGGKVLTRFGEIAAPNKTTAETPAQIHEVRISGGIAVNSAGEVFVSDMNIFDNRYHRLMRYKPITPGNFTAYEYAGTAQDISAGFASTTPTPDQPVADASGHLFVVVEESFIEEYDPATPTASALCRFAFKPGGITGMTVDPATGSTFFFSYKAPKRIHQLGPCDEASGEFEEVGTIERTPERDDIWGLAFDPVKKFAPSRPAGVLYAGAPGGASAVGGGSISQSSLGYIFAPLEESPPIVRSESATEVGITSAHLNAVINPGGFKTRYVFQYMPTETFVEGGETFIGATEAPAGGGVVGEGKADIAVSDTVLGIQPGTQYTFRVVATSNCSPAEPSKVCSVPGAAEAFRTYPAGVNSGLPSHRAWELVSPSEKHGGQVYPANPRVTSCTTGCKPGLGVGRFPMETTQDGEAVVYEGSSFEPGVGASNENQYIARRMGTGWQTSNPTPSPLISRGGQGFKAFNVNLSESILEQGIPSLSPESPANYFNLYSQAMVNPLLLRPLLVSQPPNRAVGGSNEFKVKYAGAADDLSRVFFAANDALTEPTPVAPSAVDGGVEKFNLYEWERQTGQIRLVNVKPGNTESEPGATFGAGSANSVAANGSRVFWSAESGQVYVRENAEITLQVPDAGKFLAAAADGSRVLLTNGHLYDVDTNSTADLTGGNEGFQGLVGQSDDLSHIYFVDTKVLTGEEENSEQAKAIAGQLNLYSWEGGATKFVATLLPGDNAPNNSGIIGLQRDWDPLPSLRTAKASPNGRYLAFLSIASLTGYDNMAPASARCELVLSGPPPVFGPGKCAEVFVYDSGTAKLLCPSCNPTEVAPQGFSQLPLLEGPESLPQPQYLTDSGRLFFDSSDSLTPSDTNGSAEDVYEWLASGTNGCSQEEGCLGLISGGRNGVDSNFVAADPNAKNVFFTTRDRLLPADKDELIDFYDAREFGGFATESALPPAECQGEACQLPPLAPPAEPPASSNISGDGNVKSPKHCKKGQVRKKGRCVRKGHPKKHNGKAATKNRGGQR